MSQQWTLGKALEITARAGETEDSQGSDQFFSKSQPGDPLTLSEGDNVYAELRDMASHYKIRL